ncbi:Uncharacterised protein [Paucimonas lemoignei]|jgi:hypothetical protein|nr:Uncharacterised protein [Paucimonas lemoignei]
MLSRGTGFSREEAGTCTAYMSTVLTPSRLKPVLRLLYSFCKEISEHSCAGKGLLNSNRLPPG